MGMWQKFKDPHSFSIISKGFWNDSNPERHNYYSFKTIKSNYSFQLGFESAILCLAFVVLAGGILLASQGMLGIKFVRHTND